MRYKRLTANHFLFSTFFLAYVAFVAHDHELIAIVWPGPLLNINFNIFFIII